MGGRISLVLVNLALFGLFGSCLSSLTEEFGPGWEQRWHHATDEKYTGVFVVEDIPDLEDPALKVRFCGSMGGCGGVGWERRH